MDITLPKSLLEWEWHSDTNMVRLFIHLLLKANEDGVVVTTLLELSKETGLTARELRTCIKRQANDKQNDKQISVKTTNKNTIITICNYDSYVTPNLGKRQTKTRSSDKQNDKQTTNNPRACANMNDINLSISLTPKEETDITKVICKEEKVAASAATLTQKRKERFYNTLIPYLPKYGSVMLRAFFDYWSEMNVSKTKMRFEQQPTWEVGKRLATWAKKDKNFNNGNKTNQTTEQRISKLADILAP